MPVPAQSLFTHYVKIWLEARADISPAKIRQDSRGGADTLRPFGVAMPEGEPAEDAASLRPYRFRFRSPARVEENPHAR